MPTPPKIALTVLTLNLEWPVFIIFLGSDRSINVLLYFFITYITAVFHKELAIHETTCIILCTHFAISLFMPFKRQYLS